MKRRLRLVVIVLAVLLVGAQLVPLSRTNPPVVADFDGPADVERVLRQSCYDCHSNETTWSWTAYVAPVSWLVVRDVTGGRDEFNLSAWGRMDAEDRAELPAKMVEEVEEGEMPLPAYLLAHPEARITEADLATLRAWAGTADAGAAEAEEPEAEETEEAAEPEEEGGRGRGRGRGRGGRDH